jgi:hypothetical protein
MRRTVLALIGLSFMAIEGTAQSAVSCPTITVTGPAGVVEPGKPMHFQVDVEPDTKHLKFQWAVTDSVIMGGQGTRVLTVRYLPAAHGGGVTATVTIEGLAQTCTNTAAVRHPIVVEPGPIHLGAINNTSYTIGTALLKRIEEEMLADRNSQLYVWVYVQNERQVEKWKAHILRQLSPTKIDPSRFTLNVSTETTRGAVFWRIPPGADNPTP